VPEDDQPVEAEVSGEIDRLVADTLHETAVAGDHIREVIDELGAETGCEHALGKRHPDGVRQPLTQRTCGRLNAKRVPVFGVTGCMASQLTKALQLGYGRVRVTKQG